MERTSDKLDSQDFTQYSILYFIHKLVLNGFSLGGAVPRAGLAKTWVGLLTAGAPSLKTGSSQVGLTGLHVSGTSGHVLTSWRSRLI